LPPPVVMRVGMNALFATADVVIRVGCPSADPALAYQLADRLTAAGITAAAPASDEIAVEGDLAATAWERIDVSERPVHWRAVGSMVRAVHALPADAIPDGYPVPSPASFPWWHFDALLDEVAGEIDERARTALCAVVERHRGWEAFDRSTTVVCHGDVHPGNVVMTSRGPVLLDWDLMCRAPAGWDHAMLLTLAPRWGGDPAVYPAFAQGYGASLADDPATRRFAELRNVAATLMRVRAGRTDAAARREARRRLRFWRGEPDAPPWQAQ